MGFSTVLVISLAAGVILIVGGGLMMYMANLVKSAYEIKVQINTEVEERLTKMGDDLDKKSRWIKRDLLEEIEKIKVALQTDNTRKMEELTGSLRQKVDGFEASLHSERVEWVKAVDQDRQAIASLDSRLKSAAKQSKQTTEMPTPSEPGSLAADGQAPKPAPLPAPPAKASGPTPVGEFLQELGNGTR
ncbi:MAG: hypothetical protein H7Y60_04640 [Rhodospirillaceae bacterium]|nr:hypothetical protein [Rhodospirillales bacterium]